MSVYDWVLFFIIVALAITSGVSIFWVWEWKSRHNEAVEMWQLEKNAKVKRIEYLEQQLEEAKSWERVIKIEQVHLQPRELECKFSIHPRFVEDTERFKKILVAETARYIAEEIERDPFLCKIYHSVNAFDCQEGIMVHFRMLPYAEGVVWEDIFKEEKPQTLHDLYPNPDFSRFKEEE